MRCPREHQCAAVRLLAYDRTPAGRTQLDVYRRSAIHFDALSLEFERLITVRSEIPRRVALIDLNDDEIRPVTIAVGIAPGHVTVRPRDQERQAWQRKPYEIAISTFQSLDDEPRVIPHVR